MGKFLIYTGITVGGIVGAYLPVWLFNVNPLGWVSILMGAVGSFVGLYLGYKAQQNLSD